MIAIKRVKESLLPGLFKLGSILLLVLTLTGYIGELDRIYELTSHFRPQYLVTALSLLILFLWYGAKRWAALSLLAFIINAAEVLPIYHPNGRVGLDHTKHELTLLLSNVLRTNSDYSILIELVDTTQPDLLIVLENDALWVDGLRSLARQYPYQSLMPRDDNFGIALYSRLPFDAVDVIELGGNGLPSIATKIRLSNRELSVLATHLLPPIGERNFSHRNKQLTAIASYMRDISGPRVVIGDLNVSPWSPYFKTLLEDSGLVNARQGHGLLASWPTFLPFMMIPIDHCLVSPDISVIDIDSSARVGSDHLPILVKLGI
jgi:endonuclease/exonuclease/phosphatase (EEP) superfamily protein YafD